MDQVIRTGVDGDLAGLSEERARADGAVLDAADRQRICGTRREVRLEDGDSGRLLVPAAQRQTVVE